MLCFVGRSSVFSMHLHHRRHLKNSRMCMYFTLLCFIVIFRGLHGSVLICLQLMPEALGSRLGRGRNTHTHTHTHTTILRLFGFRPGLPRWAGTRGNIHHSHLSWSSIILYLLPPFTTIHGILPVQDAFLTVFFAQQLSKSSLVWHPPLTPYISSPGHCILFTAYAHTIAACFAVVPRLYHLILVFISTLCLKLLP